MLNKIEGPEFYQKALKLAPMLKDAFEVIFECQGFIAGGFPRYVNEVSLEGNDCHRSFYDYVHNRGGDVDVFFPVPALQVKARERFKSNLKRVKAVLRSFGNFGDNVSWGQIRFDSEDQPYDVRLQLIDFRVGSPEEILGSFDLRNSMVGFNQDMHLIDSMHHIVEKHKLLDVVNWKTDAIPWRLNKYIRKYGYEGLTPETKKALPGWLLERYSEKLKFCTDKKGTKTCPRRTLFHDVDPSQFRIWTANLMHDDRLLDDNDLLLLMYMFSSQSQSKEEDLQRNSAFVSLMKRFRDRSGMSENYGGM